MPDRRKAIDFVNTIRFDTALLNSFNVPQPAQSKKAIQAIRNVMLSLCAEDQTLANSSRATLRALLLEALPNQFTGPQDQALGALDKDIVTKAAHYIHDIIKREKISFEPEPGDLPAGAAPIVIPRAMEKHKKMLREKNEGGEHEVARQVALLIRRELAKKGDCAPDTPLKHIYAAARTRMPPRGTAPEAPDFDEAAFARPDTPRGVPFDRKNRVPNINLYGPLVHRLQAAGTQQNEAEVFKIAALILKQMKAARECFPQATVQDVMFAADVTTAPFPDVGGDAGAPDTAPDVATARKADMGNFGDVHKVPASDHDGLKEVATLIGRDRSVSDAALKSATKLHKSLQKKGKSPFTDGKHLAGAVNKFLTLTKSGKRKISKPIKKSDLEESEDV